MRWARTGGDPFMDMDFVLREIDRIEHIDEQGRLGPVGAERPSTAREDDPNKK